MPTLGESPAHARLAALRWRNVDLASGQLAVIESAEQTGAGIRYKAPKNGKGRTVALPLIVITELKAWRLRQAEELLRLGIGLTDDTFICAREDGAPIQPNSIGHAWAGSSPPLNCPAFASMIFGTVTRRHC